MKKNIWIINRYLTTPELNGDGHRNYYIAKNFEKKNYDVTLLTSGFSHVPLRHNKIKGLFDILTTDVRTVLVKGIKYSNSSGPFRVLNSLLFAFLLIFVPSKKLPKPDIIIVSSLSLFPILTMIYVFKKRFKDVKFVLEIRDIWPLTLVQLGRVSKNNLIVKFFSWIEKKGYENADLITSVLENCDKHISNVLNHSDFKYKWISNGFESSDLIEDLDVKYSSQIPSKGFIVGYAGALGEANAMEYVVEAMNKIDRDDVFLVIAGNGNKEENLKRLQKNNNVIFLGRIPKKQIQAFLAKCDILYLSRGNLNIYRYGVSPQKLFDYLYSSKPILESGLREGIIEKANCGYRAKPEDADSVRQGIMFYYKKDKDFLKSSGANGRKYLLDNFQYEALTNKYIEAIEDLYV